MVSSHRLGLGMPVVAFLSLIAPAVISGTPDTHSAATTVGHTAAVAAADPTPTARAQFGRLPIAFERNQGQTDAAVAFFARGPGYSLFLTPTEAVFSLRPAPRARETHPTPTTTPAAQAPAAVVRMALSGAKRDAQIEGLEPQAGKSHYFRGNDPAQWQSDVAHYGKVRYRAVYDGIDVIYYGNQQQLEYDFVVAPGADPAQIGVQFDGPQAMRLDDSGNLVLATTQGDLLQHKPIAYQDIAGQRKPVDARYRLLADHRVAFAVGDYDRGQPLVIDPVLSYSTYLGGSGGESATDIAADAAGNVYVTGLTNSIDFPLAARAPADSKWDIFVSKLNAAGSLVYSAYLGGSGDDNAQDLAIDSLGNVYVTGDTKSSDFPTAAPLQAALGALWGATTDAFVFKLNATGNGLVYSTYLGGSSDDGARGIAVDANGNAYVVGWTQSSTFPVKAALQASLKGGSDAFVSKLNATGSALVYSTFWGGSTGRPGEFGGGWDVGYAIAVDAAGNAYITGDTTSADFPTKGPMQATFGGSPDVFVTKLNAAGSALVYSTYLGGSGHEHPEAIAVDSAGNTYVVGQTYHDFTNDFPTMAPLQGTWGGGYSDAFISKFNAAGNTLLYSTYLGGSGYDYAKDVAVDMAGNAHVTGSTASGNFPTVAAWQAGFSGPDGQNDAFVSKLNPSGSGLIYSSFLGGFGGEDHGNGIALDGAGNVYVAGGTQSFDFPKTKPWQSAIRGPDAFITKINGTLTAARGTRNDFSDDGKADIVWRNTATGANTLWLSANINTYRLVDWLDLPWKAVGLADFNGDNKTDILWRDASAGTNMIWRSGQYDPGGGVYEQAVTSLASPWFVAAVGDFNGDGRADIFWRNGSTGANGIWRSANSRFTTNPGVAPTAWVVVGAGDFDGDRKADVLWRNSSTGANSLWKSGNATTGVSLVSVPNLAWKVAGVGDFDGDGKDDILWRNYSTGANSLWKSGNAAAGVSLGGVSNFAWKIASVGDYDGDRRSDILWRNSSTGANVIWKSANYSTPQTVTGVTSQAWIIVP